MAAVAGLRMIEAGGTAVDACLAMAATAWIVMPDMCGPGGDLFALWREPDGAVHAVNGSGRASTRFVMPENPADRAALTLLPGAPSAIRAITAHACRFDLATLFAPAIAAARAGFVVTPRLDKNLQVLPDGRFKTEVAAAYGGVLPRAGERCTALALGESLERWARERDAGGLLAEALSEWAQQGAAVDSAEVPKLAATIEPALLLRLNGWHIFGQPPLSAAVATLAALGIAGGDAIIHSEGAYRDHLLIEAYKTAYADLLRMGHKADLAQLIAEMLNGNRLRALRERIGPRAARGASMQRNYGETTQCAAADGEGRVCTVIHSLYRPFGSRLLSRTTGWIANDRGATFSDGPNAPAPGRCPRHTLVGVIAVAPDGGAFAFGTPGAQAQTQTTLQVLADLMRGAHPWTAIEAPRWSFIGDDHIAVEAAMPSDTLAGLERAGHRLALRPPADWLMGSVSLAAAGGGLVTAAADHRREALALAL
jgi:gamma-glutamyltranspeptidase/glutathione hydrolase